MYRALNGFALRYGPWLMKLDNCDPVAIVVSKRQIKLDAWGGIGGQYFTRLWEAYQSCLYARCPATFIFAEDKPDLSRFKALLVVDQRYEPEQPLAELLANAKKSGLAIFADSTCRDSLVKEFTPLGIAFDKIEKLNGFNNDAAYFKYPSAILSNVPALTAKFAPAVTPVAQVDQAEVLVSVRRSGDARFVWVVNNTRSPLDPGLLWRVQNAVSTCNPVVAHVKLPVEKGAIVYDVFSGKEVGPEFDADLRYSQARLYAILPGKIRGVKINAPGPIEPGKTIEWSAQVSGAGPAPLPLSVRLLDGANNVIEETFTSTGSGQFVAPANARQPMTIAATELITGQSGASKPDAPYLPPASAFGPRLRDIAVSNDGSTALLNAFDWGRNLYALDLATGKIKWTENIGDYFAFAPSARGSGFAAQGFDLKTGEGYHLYALDRNGVALGRFALPGLPAKMTNWAFPAILNDHINNFAVSPDGSWIAGAGNLALAVCNDKGEILWSKDWSRDARQTMKLLAVDGRTLLTAQKMRLSALDPRREKRDGN